MVENVPNWTRDRAALNRVGFAKEQLDDTDRCIVELLNADGRVSNRDLAAAVRLTEATVAARIRSLIDKRILGITTVFDWQKAGFLVDMWVQVFVGGRLARDVAADIAKLAQTHCVLVVFGEPDVVVHALLPDHDAAARFIAEDLKPIEGVVGVDSTLTLRMEKYNVNFARMPISATEFDFPAPVIELDDTDRRVLSAIAADGRRSNREIARELGVSDSTVRLRIKRMEAANLLRISGQTDPYLTGQVDAWALVCLETVGDTRLLAKLLAAFHEVGIVAELAGTHQLLLLVITVDRPALIEFVSQRLHGSPMVLSSRTWEILHTEKLDYHWGRL
ncbi:Lrp/AsnC family transcriptional regulator [Rhodococcus aetherivorans]